MPPVAVRMPNGALTSLAGNIDDRGCTLRSVLGLEDDRKPSSVTRQYDIGNGGTYERPMAFGSCHS
jgi:hypothetical protein